MIALTSKVQDVIIGIQEGTIVPVLDTGSGYIFVFNNMLVPLGSMVYTAFDRNTLFPVASFSVKFGTYHTIGQIISEPMPSRRQLEKIVDMEIPGMLRPEFNPQVVTGGYTVYPTMPATEASITDPIMIANMYQVTPCVIAATEQLGACPDPCEPIYILDLDPCRTEPTVCNTPRLTYFHKP